MARPRAVLPDAEALAALIDGEGRLSLRATPGARVEELAIADGKVTAKVRAPAEDGRANEAVRELVARALGVAAGRVTLLRGATSREKMFRIET